VSGVSYVVSSKETFVVAVLSSLEKAYRLEVNPTNLSGTEKKTCRPPFSKWITKEYELPES
jgi:hypothetical protein